MPRINMSEIWALWLSTTMDYSSLNWTGASNDWPSRAWYKLIYIFFISSSTVPTIIFLRLSLKSLKFWPVEFVLQIEFWVSYGVMRPWCLKRSLPSDLDKVDVNFCHEAKFCGTFTEHQQQLCHLILPLITKYVTRRWMMQTNKIIEWWC